MSTKKELLKNKNINTIICRDNGILEIYSKKNIKGKALIEKLILYYNEKSEWVGFESEETMTQKEFKKKYLFEYKKLNIK